MKAIRVRAPASIDEHPLFVEDIPIPSPDSGQALIKVEACGVCHTDLHIVEGDITPPRYPITPGHQVVGTIEKLGSNTHPNYQIGDRVGLPWLYSACGECSYCLMGQENLCPNARFSGFHEDGGFAEYLTAELNYLLPLPKAVDPITTAPLLCAGIVGYRALKRAGVLPGEKVALVGFGASAHLMIQVLNYWGCEVSVITRSKNHQDHAAALGSGFHGKFEDQPPNDHHRAIIFTPAGSSVTNTLKILRPGGVVSINAIHMSDIPSFPYVDLYGERSITSVTNATYQDGVEFLQLAASFDLHAETTQYDLNDATRALQDLKHSRINGEGVLVGF